VAPRPWYRSSRELSRVKAEVLSRHPALTFKEVDGRVIVYGVFEIREGKVLHDKLVIEVELARDSARGIPVVRETGGRIPRTADRHVNTEDGSLCVVLPDAYWYHHTRGLTFADFLDGPLRAHLAGQLLVELGEPWPAGEWGHGINGILEFYFEVLRTKEPKPFVGLLGLLARPEVKGHWACPCGSGELLRKCHGPRILHLRARIPQKLAKRALDLLRSASTTNAVA